MDIHDIVLYQSIQYWNVEDKSKWKIYNNSKNNQMKIKCWYIKPSFYYN